MQFSTREDIEAPIEHVFAQVADFRSFERSALRRGADVARIDALQEPGVGMQWDVKFDLRGKQRELHLELARYDVPHGIEVVSTSQSLAGDMVIELVALSRMRTRLSLDVMLKPQNLSARLLVQSLKLARTNLNKRFRVRVAEYAKEVEDRFQKTV